MPVRPDNSADVVWDAENTPKLGGFGKIVEKAVASQANGLCQVGQAGYHYNRCLGIPTAEEFEKIVALAVRQVIVEQDDIELALRHSIPGVGKVVDDCRHAILAPDHLSGHRRKRGIIVDYQARKTILIRCRRSHVLKGS